MKTYWKWILGILIVAAVIVAIPLGMHYLMNKGIISNPAVFVLHRNPTGPAFDRQKNFDGWNGPRGFYDNRGGWDRHGRGFGFFGPLMFLGGLLKLAVFGGLLYGAYWLGRRNARLTLNPAPAAPATAPAPKRGAGVAKKA